MILARRGNFILTPPQPTLTHILADEDYYTHMVGPGLDLRFDYAPDKNQSNVYSTDVFASRATEWITEAVHGGAKNSFGYLAFQAIHAPQQAPSALVESGFCADAIPADYPTRRIACGQMRAVDAAVARVIATYKALGIWEETLVILSADNGGNVDTVRRLARPAQSRVDAITTLITPPFPYSGRVQLATAWSEGHDV